MLAATVATSTGCSHLIDSNVPEPIRPYTEPELGRKYLLYRPSSYDPELYWPLVVVCHSSFPDAPNPQIRHWTELAESSGFIVVAPRLKGTKTLAPTAARQLARQREDERNILAALQHVRAGHSISEDRIFIHGWSGGAYAALHTGLKNPQTFRAISLIGPKFSSGYLADVADRVDHYQPVYLNYNIADTLTGKHGRQCADWLRSKGANLRVSKLGSARALDTRPVVEFYEDVARNHPWIHVRAFSANEDNPLAVQFKLRCSYRPGQYHWEFGDGDVSPVAEPVHIYAAPGTYTVSVTLEGPRHREDRRKISLKVPGMRLGPADHAS
jgi:dienelactone hydrolase